MVFGHVFLAMFDSWAQPCYNMAIQDGGVERTSWISSPKFWNKIERYDPICIPSSSADVDQWYQDSFGAVFVHFCGVNVVQILVKFLVWALQKSKMAASHRAVQWSAGMGLALAMKAGHARYKGLRTKELRPIR